MTALHVATSRGHLKIVERLLGAGLNPDAATSDNGKTALHVAAKLGGLVGFGRLEMVGSS